MAEVAVYKDFADWYRIVSFELHPEVLQRRWKGIAAFTKECKVLDVPDLARLFYGLKLRQGDFLERFRSAFKTVDESFSMRDDNAELRILAGSSLVDLLRYPRGWDQAAAFAIAAGECQGLRTPPVRDIPTIARNFLAKASADLRGAAKLAAPATADPAPKLGELKAALQTNELPRVNEPLSATLQIVSDAIRGLTSWAASVSAQEELRREESDVLWWLFGGHSRDLNKPFCELAQPSAILVAAKELSDLTRVMPGPLPSRAFLDTVIRDAHPQLSGKQSVADVLAACPLAWQEQFVAVPGFSAVDDLCPIHAAAAKSVDTAGEAGWQSAYTNVTGLQVTARFDALDMAFQAYEECLLIRLIHLLGT